MTLLWLDDICIPNIKQVVKLGTVNFDRIYRVKSYGEFTRWITENGLPDFVSFDYKLDENPELRWKLPPSDWYKSTMGARSYTGYDCAKWLVFYCNNTGTNLPYFNCHSGDQEERRVIEGFLNRYVLTVENDTFKQRQGTG